MATDKPEGSIEVFCSYSHVDERLRTEFGKWVKTLKDAALVNVWNDREIRAGDDWNGEIDARLNSADIIVLLVSVDFLVSDYCNMELRTAMQRADRKEAIVVPIIVRDCDWSDAPFAKLQALPADGKAVTLWPNQDSAWKDVTLHLKVVVQELLMRARTRLTNRFEEALRLPAAGNETQQKLQRERWRILQETQRKIFEIQQEVTAATSKSQGEAYKRWQEFLR